MATSVSTSETFSTGSLSGNTFSTLVTPLSGVVFLALRLLNYWELFILISSCFGRQSLRSASRGDFLVPKGLHDHHTTYGFLDWYSLPSELCSLPRDLPCSSCKFHETSFCPGLS